MKRCTSKAQAIQGIQAEVPSAKSEVLLMQVAFIISSILVMIFSLSWTNLLRGLPAVGEEFTQLPSARV